MSIIGYTFRQAYRRVVRTSNELLGIIQETSLNEMVLSRIVLTLKGCESLPAHRSDAR